MKFRQACKIMKKYVSRDRWTTDTQKMAVPCGFLFCSAGMMQRAEARYNKYNRCNRFDSNFNYSAEQRILIPETLQCRPTS